MRDLLGAGILGDGLGALRDGVLGELTGEEEPDSGLDLTRGDGGPLVVVSQTGGLGGDPLEQIIDERVHDAHGLGGDTGVRVDLFQHLVDVDGVRLPPPLPALLVPRTLGLGLAGLLLGSLASGFGWHVALLSIPEELTTIRPGGYLYEPVCKLGGECEQE